MTAAKAKPALDVNMLRPLSEADKTEPILAWLPHGKRYAVMYWVNATHQWLEMAGAAERPSGFVNIDLSGPPQ